MTKSNKNNATITKDLVLFFKYFHERIQSLNGIKQVLLIELFVQNLCKFEFLLILMLWETFLLKTENAKFHSTNQQPARSSAATFWSQESKNVGKCSLICLTVQDTE